jgi:hypothetical protein
MGKNVLKSSPLKPVSDHPCHVCVKLADWFQRRRLLNNFPIGSNVKTVPTVAILNQVSDTGSPELLVFFIHQYPPVNCFVVGKNLKIFFYYL